MKTKTLKVIADDKYFEDKDTSKLKEFIKKVSGKQIKKRGK